MKKRIAVLGSTGSIGRQTLEVVSASSHLFDVVSLATKGYLDIFEKQIKQFKPRTVSIADEGINKSKYSKMGPKVLSGSEALIKLATDPKADIIVMSIVGTPGLPATIAAIKKGKTVALASKEVLVAAGEIVMPLIKKHKAQFLPLDSEHSAIFQCLGTANGRRQTADGPGKQIKRLILTASGGPFRKFTKQQLKKVTAKMALAHPTWTMGPKITVDCSTLMNKGLEVIEAHHLFGIPYDRIDVVVHPQSMIHSMVEFVDGSIIAQIGVPDMRTPIQYALTYPERHPNHFGCVDFAKLGSVTFEEPDTDRFPCLKIAYDAGRKGGTAPAVLSAANDTAVELFLKGKIGFTDIPKIVSSVLKKHRFIKKPTLAQVLEAEKWAREEASGM